MEHPTTGCTILMVDDEEANLDLLEAFLLAEGYASLVRTSDSREAIPLFEAHAPDLLLLDLHMPYRDGLAVLRDLRERTPEDDYLPVLVLTADITPEAKERALSGGARDFLTKPFDAVEVLLRVRNLLQTRLLHRTQRAARERAEALAAENARLFAGAQQATRARDRMLSVVAHDLRNPLALVAMHAEMMLELLPPDADRYQREALEVMCQATDRMQRLIEDLLEVSRFEQGTFSLQLAEHPVEELFAEAEQLLRPAAEAGGIDLRFAAAAGLPPLRVDGARVIQVISNLIGNAIKFTPEAGRVSVACDAAGEYLEVSVVDTGPGIPVDELPHIFGAFWQADDADRRGVGLGLWIARSIVEAHGGRIRVDSREGQGTRFGFTLPHATSAATPRAAGDSRTVAVPGVIAEPVSTPSG
jgi:signal transduction histidine kinase